MHTTAPTYGSGGTRDDKLDLGYTDSRGLHSRYHLFASHLTGSGPWPIVVHLHGDGGYEYRNPGTWTTPRYRDAARAHNALFLVPRTPQTGLGYTWWRRYSSSQWLADFLRFEYRYYNIDRRRVFLSGFSGGAQALSYNLIADRHDLMLGGGSMLLGGGGTSGMSITGTPSAEVRARFLMRWHVGEFDDGRNTSDGFNALNASAIGERTYRDAGWDTRRVLIPGEDHGGSESYGPHRLRQVLDEHANLIGH